MNPDPKKLNKAQAFFTEAQYNHAILPYAKFGEVFFRPATFNECVFTMTSGQLETTKTSTFGDVVLRNIAIGGSFEQYIIGSVAKFLSRYEIVEGFSANVDGSCWGKATPTGKVNGVEYFGPSFSFESPWGDDMIVNEGDFIVKIPGEEINKVYRIEREAFDLTYALDD